MTDEQGSIIEYEDDISNAEAPEPLPEGDYPAVVRSAERKVSGAGNPYVAVGFYISPDDYPPDFPVEEEPDGVLLTYRRVPGGTTKRDRYRMRMFCESIGAPTGSRMNLNDWIGLNASVTVVQEDYEGEPRAQIVKVSAE